MPQPTPPKISRYLPVWTRLKTDKTVKVTAPVKYHAVIIKMIRRRRDKDTGYRFECAEANLNEQIRASIEGTVITFTLKRVLSWRDL